MLVAALVAGSLLCDTAVFAQAGGGGGGGGAGGRGGRGGVLTQEQNQQLRDALTASQADVTALTDKLTAAQKEAIDAALTAGASDSAVQAKLEAVAKIQTEIAMLRYSKGVKPIAASVTADQKTQIDAAPGATYNQFFGAGAGGGRGGAAGGAGGRGGGRGGRRGGGGAAPGA